MNSTGTKIQVEGTIYTLDGDTILYNEDDVVIAIGNEDIEEELETGVSEVADIVVVDGVVESLVLLD